MQALFLPSLGGGDGSSNADTFLEEALAAFGVLVFFPFDFLLGSVDGPVPLLLRFRFTEDLGASGEVDMSRFGSWNASPSAAERSFALRFFFLVVPFGVFTAGAGPSFASESTLSLSQVSLALVENQ